MTKLLRAGLIGVALAAGGGVPAGATTLVWEFSYAGTDDFSTPISASGELLTDPLSGGTYLITGINGARNGDPITGLIAAQSDASWSDNLVLDIGPGLDEYGFSYTTLSGGSINVFHDQVPNPPDDPAGCGSTVYAEIPGPAYTCSGGFELTSFSLTYVGEAPEPASLGLLAVGVAGVWGVRRRGGRRAG